MRFRRWLFPVAFYLLGLLLAWGYPRVIQIQVRRAVGIAGSQGKPIVFSFGTGNWFGSFRLLTEDTDPIRLPSKIADLRMINGTDVEPDGSIVLFGTTNFHDAAFDILDLRRLWSQRQVKVQPGEAVQAHPSDLKAGSALSLGGLWILSIENQEFTAKNIGTGETRILNSDSSSPWAADQTGIEYYMGVMSPEGDVLFWAETTYSPSFKMTFWRLDTSTGVWTRLGDLNYSVGFTAGEHGDLIALSQSGSSAEFRDGRTSQPVKTEPSGWSPCIGERWAACIIPGNNTWTLRLYDILNDWQVHDISASPSDLRCHGMADPSPIVLYEPPPNGLDGMYENYKP